MLSRCNRPVVPIEDATYIVLDTELTGLDENKDSIISIGAVRMRGGIISLADTFYRLVNPRTPFRSESVVIHEITPSDVDGEPDIETALSEFLLFCCDDILVGHCVSIDLGFLNRQTRQSFGLSMKNPAVDTFSIYCWLRKRQADSRDLPHIFTDSGLYTIAQYFGIDVRNAHNALTDAFIAAQVFQRFIPMLVKNGIRDTGDLLRIGTPSMGGGDTVSLSLESFSF